MEKVAVICSANSKLPHERQGATQTNTFEATKRYKRYKPYLFSSAFAGRPDEEILEGVHIKRIRSNIIDRTLFAITHFKNPDHHYVHRVAEEIKKLKIKIVHVRNRPLYMPYLRELLEGGVKLILHEHNQNIADTLSEKTALSILNSIDAYIGVSKFTMDHEIVHKYPQFSNKSYYILNGVDIEKFRPAWEKKEEALALRKKYDLQNSKVILFVDRKSVV